jgi:hypothetical protein
MGVGSRRAPERRPLAAAPGSRWRNQCEGHARGAGDASLRPAALERTDERLGTVELLQPPIHRWASRPELALVG